MITLLTILVTFVCINDFQGVIWGIHIDKGIVDHRYRRDICREKTSAKKIILHSLNFVQINQWRLGETGKSHLRQRFRRCVANFLSMQYKVLSSFQELYWANSFMMSIPSFAKNVHLASLYIFQINWVSCIVFVCFMTIFGNLFWKPKSFILAINWWHNYETAIFQQYSSKSAKWSKEQFQAIITCLQMQRKFLKKTIFL